MLPSELLIKRLAYIKQLYRIGIEQSKQNEGIAVFSILAFQDSIEMFLNLLTEHKNIDAKNFKFMEHWDKIPDLTLKESIRKLNERRVNLKHKGLLPAKSEIEISRVNTTDFFEQNTLSQFGIDFKNISLIELVTYQEVKTYLIQAQADLDANNNENSIIQTAYAFKVLIFTYRQNKSSWQSPFNFGPTLSFKTSFMQKIVDKKVGDSIDAIIESVESLKDVVEIMSFGINYKEYIKFDTLTPYVSRTQDGTIQAQIRRNKKWSTENCQYCIDFVIKTSLMLQDFDFDISSLQE